MKKYFIVGIFALLFMISSFAPQKEACGTTIIKGHITETFSYCGGARPPAELLEELGTPKPMKNKTIFIKIGTSNKSSKRVYKKIITDDNGNFSVELIIGKTYCFLEDWKGKPLNFPKDTVTVKWDHTCIIQRYKTADFILKVQASNNPVVTINFHQPCAFHPICGSYSGYLPQ